MTWIEHINKDSLKHDLIKVITFMVIAHVLTVKTTPKMERIVNPAGRTTDHVEYKVTGPTGMVHRFKSKSCMILTK